MRISGRMLLRLEQGIKIPEAAFDIFVSRHFRKAHFEKDLTEFITDLEEWVEMATWGRETLSVKVVLFEGCCFPFATTLGMHYLASIS